MKGCNIFRKIKNIFSRIISRLRTECTIMYIYPYIYKKYSKDPIDENKVIFIESRLSELSNSFRVLYSTLSEETDYELKCHFLRKTFVKDSEYVRRCKELIKDMSTAGYIFMDEATHITAKIKLRPETQMVQLWHGCGAFKKFGYSVTDGKFGASQRAKTRYPVHTNYTLATVSSPEVITHFEDAMNLKGKNTVKATGVSRTDIFYNEGFIKDAHSKLYRLFPEAKNKKVILYAPTFRGNVENALAPDKLDLSLLNESLSDEYVLILKHHPLVRTKPEIPSELKKTFAADLSDEMSVDELLCVSDICISDYSSLIFEYSIFSKPMIFFAYDLKEYFDSRGFYYDYDAFTPGPVFSHTSEICEYIRNISSNFDETVITQFREKFMRSCDGKATKRIIGEVFGSNYSEHLKQ